MNISKILSNLTLAMFFAFFSDFVCNLLKKNS